MSHLLGENILDFYFFAYSALSQITTEVEEDVQREECNAH